MEEVVPLIIAISKCVGPPLWGYIQYYRHRKTCVKVLNDLKSRKEDIEQKLNAELKAEIGPRKLPKSEVTEWLENVQKVIENIEGMIKHKKFSSNAIDDGREYLKKGSFNYLVIDAKAMGRLLCTKTTMLVEQKTTKECIDKIWGYLMGDEVTKIGVCGMGGIGKTTIMEHINNKLLEESHNFDCIIWVTVHQVDDHIKLQKDIATEMNEEFQESVDEKRGAGILLKMLKGRKVVLILDGVWKTIQLDKLGFPEPNKENGCKLVITTRSMDICRFMSCKLVKVNFLSKPEAVKLFLHEAELDISRFTNLEKTVNDIVEQCAGLPHAIETVACCMKGQYDTDEWRIARDKLSDYRRSAKLMKNVFEKIKLSYDALEDEKVQHCLLYCALFPENYDIPKNEFLNFCIAEGFVDEMNDLQATEDEAHDIMNGLINNCLLLTRTDYVERSYVKLHGVVRKMVLTYVTSKNPLFMVKVDMNLKELPPEQDWKVALEKVSFMNNSIRKIPPNMSPDCPHLSTLLLQENPLLGIPENFFKKMPNLKILNLSKTGIGELPNSISDLSNLTTLSLNHCPNLRNVSFLGKLKALKSFDASHCEKLAEISHEENKKELILPGLRMLSLKNLPNLKSLCGSDGVMVCDSIQKFEIYNCRELKKTFSPKEQALKNLEELVVENCNEMEEIIALDADRKEKSKRQITLPKLRNLILRRVPKLESICGSNGIMAGDHLQKIEIFACSKLQKILSPSNLWELKNLEEIDVSYCDELVEMIALDVGDEETITQELRVPNLRSLSLKRNLNLKSICGSNGVMHVNDSLQKIKIDYCPELEKIVSASKLLANLKEVDVSYCDELEEMIVLDVGDEETIRKELSVPKLRSLSLKKILNLKSICGSNGVMHVSDSLQKMEINYCPVLKKIVSAPKLLANLKEIDVSDCDELEEMIALDVGDEETIAKELSAPKLRSLSLKKMRNLKSICGSNGVMHVSDSLQKIEIEYCPELKKIVSPSKLLAELTNLEEICVGYCDEVEDVITLVSDGEGKNNKELGLPKLAKLILRWMPNLKGFYGNNGVTVSDSLQSIKIRSCPMLKKILSPSKLLDLKNLEEIDVSYCDEMEELIAFGFDKEEESNEELSLPKLTNLILVSVSNLKTICGNYKVTVGGSLQKIEIQSCQMLKIILSPSKLELENLEVIHVDGCTQMKEIITIGAKKDASDQELSLPKLTRLILKDIQELTNICESNGILVGDSLKEIKVETCPKLRKIISPSKSLLELRNLEDIEVKHCEEIKEIIASNIDIVQAERNKKQLTLSKLKKLNLCSMKRLESICGRNGVMVGDSVEQIEVRDCPKLKKIISPSKSLQEFKRLQEIKVKHCDEMKEIITSNVDPEESKEGLSLPKLKELELHMMPKLKSINCGSNIVKVCETIKTIQISYCPSLENLQLKPAGQLFEKDGQPTFRCYFDRSAWDSLKWAHPNAKDVILRCCVFDPKQFPA